jgi:hypothetical protein
MEVLGLNLYNRIASLGDEYYYLKKIFPEWSFLLHNYGNELDNNIIEMIGINGIVEWYMRKNIEIDLNYDYKKIGYLKQDINSITYYDFYNILKLCKHLKIDVKEFNDFDFNIEYKYKYFMSIFKNMNFRYENEKEKYFVYPFSVYIIDILGKDKIIQILEECDNYIESKKYWFEYGSFFNTFIKRYECIKNWVIIFQKFKIILEKISHIYHPDIYKIDIFVEETQKCIYSLIIYYIKNFIDNKKDEIILNSNIINILKNDKLLKYYNNDEIKTFTFDLM